MTDKQAKLIDVFTKVAIRIVKEMVFRTAIGMTYGWQIRKELKKGAIVIRSSHNGGEVHEHTNPPDA